MSLTSYQQFQQLVRTAKDILILTPEHSNGDVFCSASGLALALEARNKTLTVAGSKLPVTQKKFEFIKRPNSIVAALSGARDFIISFNTKYNPIQRIRSEQAGEEYRIYVTPEHGSIDPRDFSFIPAKFKFDLVIIIGAPDKESLGKLYEDNADIFYEIPVINIDNHPQNDNFGQLNLVDITASSCSEIITNLLTEIYNEPIEKDIAECLLTGIIAATDSFQKKNTTPKAFQTASTLMDFGADQQMIVQHLYKTQPLHLLKLWGQIMAKLKWDESIRLAWSPVDIEDFVQSRSRIEDIPQILDKIKSYYAAGSLFLLLFHDTPTSVRAIIKAHSIEPLLKLSTLWNKSEITDDSLEFSINNENLNAVEAEVVSTLKSALLKK